MERRPVKTDADLLVARNGEVGVIALDRPRARNALTLAMVEAFSRALENFESDRAVTSVIVRSTSEGTFCAGGDVRAIYRSRLEGRHEEADAFFEREFALNEFIHRFPKPYVSLIDGTCFGGGMGITIHGRVRIVGEKAVLAMPETAIGYFPDVGASHFLNRMPMPMARFLGLTGYPLSPEDALFAGLATKFVAGDRHPEIERRLAGGEPVDDVLDALGEAPGEGRLARHADIVERCFSLGSIAEMKDALRLERSEFAAEALAKLERAAPSSLAATVELLERTVGMSLRQCLAIELDLARQVTRGRDFAEGIRALLVDKDRNPRWAAAEPGIAS
jgi:enoyl-CoA hydratase